MTSEANHGLVRSKDVDDRLFGGLHDSGEEWIEEAPWDEVERVKGPAAIAEQGAEARREGARVPDGEREEEIPGEVGPRGASAGESQGDAPGGASVITMAIHDPAPGGANPTTASGLSSARAAPSGTPAIVSSDRAPKFAWRHTPTT